MTRPLARDDVVLITGASAGIGQAMALRLARRGVRLALAARGAEELEGVARLCRDRGTEAEAYPTDVSVEEEARAFVRAAVGRFGRVDALVNNAGITHWAAFERITDLAMAERLLHVNVLGCLYATHEALPHLRATRGRLGAVSSLAGLSGVPMRSIYSATKHAVRGFFDSLRIELAGSGVTVTVAYPGFVATRGRARGYGEDGGPLGESRVDEGAIMSAEACARLIVRALDRRDREVVMTARGKVGRWVKLIAPSLVDRVVARAMTRGK